MSNLTKASKYHNEKTMVDGIVFLSIKEANRYRELKLLEKANEITQLRLQVPFVLYAKVKYVADFVYVDSRYPDVMTVEDVKGVRTELYKLKKKLFLDKYKETQFRFIET